MENIKKRLDKHNYATNFTPFSNDKVECSTCRQILGKRKSAWDDHLEAIHPGITRAYKQKRKKRTLADSHIPESIR
jgi:hypothetical protein